MSDAACRIDVWLWRARFFKTRALAVRAVDDGRIRLARSDGSETRVDKASRTLRAGDSLIFALGGRLHAVRIEGLGMRRGPAAEARALYATIGDAPVQPLTTGPPD